jgi:hypothetical protein
MGDTEYNTASMVMGFYGGLLQGIAKQYGWEKALEMHGKIGYPMGVGSAEEFKKAAGKAKPTAAIVEAINSKMMTDFGADFKVTKDNKTVKFEVTKCPMYDGLRGSGFSHEQVKSLCEAIASQEYAGITSLTPNIVGKVKVRDGTNGTCIEEFKIT